MLNWFALYTKSRREKFIKQELTNRGIESFLPIRKIRKHWSGRFAMIKKPLFANYIFVKTDPINRIAALRVRGAIEFVSAGLKFYFDRKKCSVFTKKYSSE